MNPILHRICLLWVALFTAPLDAQDGSARQRHGPACLTIQAPTKDGRLHIRLADLLPFMIEIAAQEVEVPREVTRSASWILHKSTPAEWSDRPGQKIWRRSFWLEPLSPGDLPLRLEPWKVRIDDQWRDIAWDEVTVKVQSVVEVVDPKKARPITSIEELPSPPTSAAPTWPWIVGGGILLFLAGLLVGRCWRRSPPKPTPTPRQWALGQIDRLARRRLPEKNATALHLRLLSLILRSYLEKTAHLPARRWTTAELITGLSRAHSEAAAEVGAILERADLIRFTGSASSLAECDELAEKTRRFILSYPATEGPAEPGRKSPE